MKKLISILLVAMLIIGMFPATVSAVDTQIVFNLGANGSASHADGSSKTSYTETVDGYKLNITGGTNMYTGARDAKGNSCIKLGASSKAGSFKFTVPDDVTSVVIAIAKYKSSTSKVTINGTTTTLTKNSNDGAYDQITVDTSSTKTISLTTVSGGYRAMVNTITFIVPAQEGACEHPENKLTLKTEEKKATCTEAGHEAIYTCDCGEEVGGKVIPAIDHANKTLQNEAVAGTCKTEGATAIYYCPDCDTTLGGESTGLGKHNYVDGACDVCGEAEPEYRTATITFDANKTQRTAFSTTSQVWSADDITFTNNKGSGSTLGDYSNPVRLYKESEIIVSCKEGYVITSITFVAADESKYKTPWAATLASASPVVDGDNYTVNFQSGVTEFSCKATAQIRASAITVTYAKEKDPVVEVNGKEYASVDQALAEIAANGGTMKLLAAADGINYSGELYLDLNGFNATNVTASKVYAYDNKATTSSTEFATLTTTSEVVIDNTVGGVRYIALNKNGTYTFHVLEMKVTAISLRAAAAGVYYKAKIICDEELAKATQSYGMLLSTYNMPGADFLDDGTDVNGYTVQQGNPTSDKVFTSGAIFGIFKDTLSDDINRQRGEIKIYANAYLKLDEANGGKILVADTTTGDKTTDEGFNGIVWSLKDVLVKLNDATSLSEANKAQVRDFYDTWNIAEFGWDLENIATWSPSVTE